MATVARETWTDERLDDLKGSVDAGFADNREEFRAVRTEMREEFQAVRSEMREEFQAVRSEMREGFGAIRGEIQGVRDEVAALNRSFQQLTWGLIGAMLLGFLGTISAIITQL